MILNVFLLLFPFALYLGLIWPVGGLDYLQFVVFVAFTAIMFVVNRFFNDSK